MDESDFDSILVEIKRKFSETSVSLSEFIRISESIADSIKDCDSADDYFADSIVSNPDNSSDIICFNVGGSLFSTRRNILLNTRLESAVTQSDSLSQTRTVFNNQVFIDRNPEYFSIILDYLRSSGEFVIPQGIDLNRLRFEAIYYKVNGLLDLIDRQFLKGVYN